MLDPFKLHLAITAAIKVNGSGAVAEANAARRTHFIIRPQNLRVSNNNFRRLISSGTVWGTLFNIVGSVDKIYISQFTQIFMS